MVFSVGKLVVVGRPTGRVVGLGSDIRGPQVALYLKGRWVPKRVKLRLYLVRSCRIVVISIHYLSKWRIHLQCLQLTSLPTSRMPYHPHFRCITKSRPGTSPHGHSHASLPSYGTRRSAIGIPVERTFRSTPGVVFAVVKSFFYQKIAAQILVIAIWRGVISGVLPACPTTHSWS